MGGGNPPGPSHIPALSTRRPLAGGDRRSWHQNGFRIHDGKFYFTLGDRQSDVWMTELAASR